MSAIASKRLALTLIRRDGGTQPRDHVSSAIATSYAEDMKDGATFPPVVTYFDGRAYWLADGFHRVMAVELLGGQEIDAEVRQGDQRAAILHSVGANAQHGYRRTNDDKRRAVRTLVEDPEWSGWSDREIARRCHVGPDMVGRMRPAPSVDERQTGAAPARKVSRGGKVYEMATAGINKDRSPPSAAPAMTGRGSKQLRILLGELRNGTDIESAAIVAEIPLGEAIDHMRAEEKGEYKDIVHIQPPLIFDGEKLVVPPPVAMNDVAEQTAPAAELPQAFDFAIAQTRQRAMDAIIALSKAPAPDELAKIWSRFLGPPVPVELVEDARAWLEAFAQLFPAADARRREAVAQAMEKL